jgi:hypothetical protein
VGVSIQRSIGMSERQSYLTPGPEAGRGFAADERCESTECGSSIT